MENMSCAFGFLTQNSGLRKKWIFTYLEGVRKSSLEE